RALGKQEWQVKNHLRWARGFSDGDLERALVEAAALERILKGTGDSDAAFVSYVARVCGA
ncbi:MAG: DNA polymerase III subunit delta, partial [Atopobiaceae bacterium]|nr:DNA polymerase III subunit delta [Atopobiaceae bacterium]